MFLYQYDKILSHLEVYIKLFFVNTAALRVFGAVSKAFPGLFFSLVAMFLADLAETFSTILKS